MTCDAQGLIGRDMFAIDGVKLPSNASKGRSGTQEELLHRADRLELCRRQDHSSAPSPVQARGRQCTGAQAQSTRRRPAQGGGTHPEVSGQQSPTTQLQRLGTQDQRHQCEKRVFLQPSWQNVDFWQYQLQLAGHSSSRFSMIAKRVRWQYRFRGGLAGRLG